MSHKKKLSADESNQLLIALKTRFEKNKNRHKGLEWDKVQARLEAHPEKLWSLNEMERTGGEPDAVGQDKKRVNTYFMTALQKVRKAGEAFVMTGKGRSQGNLLRLKTMQLKWPGVWALSS